MRLRSKSIYVLVFVILPISLLCKSMPKRTVDKPDSLADNYWYNDNKLQIITQSLPAYIDKPIVYVHKDSCQRAKSQIDKKIIRLYPALMHIKYQQEIRYTLYYGAGGCRLVVHISAEDLKNKVSQRS